MHDTEIQRRALAYIRRHCMHVDLWEYTMVGSVHPELAQLLDVGAGELPLVSSWVSMDSWYVFTTRRVISRYRGTTDQLLAPAISGKSYGNFKGHTRAGSTPRPTEIAVLEGAESGETLQLEFETSYASMALIYACMFWERKFGFLALGRTNEEPHA